MSSCNVNAQETKYKSIGSNFNLRLEQNFKTQSRTFTTVSTADVNAMCLNLMFKFCEHTDINFQIIGNHQYINEHKGIAAKRTIHYTMKMN